MAVLASAPGLPDLFRTLLPWDSRPALMCRSPTRASPPGATLPMEGSTLPKHLISCPWAGRPERALPDTFGVTYLVPSDTTAITTTASAKLPIIDETLFGIDGDPDIFGAVVGRVATVSLSANPVAHGLWIVAPEEVGPDGVRWCPPCACEDVIRGDDGGH